MQKLEMGFHAGKFQDGTAKGCRVVDTLTKANKTGAAPEGGALAKLTQISVNVFRPYSDLSGLRRSDLGKPSISTSGLKVICHSFSNKSRGELFN